MLERYKVEVDQLSGGPNLPVGQDDIQVVLRQVLLDLLHAQPL